MKTYLILGIVLILSACTSQEGHLKKAALERAELKWTESLTDEARRQLSESEVLQKAYLEFMDKNSELEIDQIEFQGESRATVSVNVLTFTQKLRLTLLDVASRVGMDKTRRFNFKDALVPVALQVGEKTAKERRPLIVYKFTKGSDGLWRAE